MKNVDIVDNLSTLFVENLLYFQFMWIMWKSYPQIMWKNHAGRRVVESVEKLSTEIVDKSLGHEISYMKTSYPQ